MMSFLPIYYQVSGARILLIGGGHVAVQKVRLLLDYAAALVVVAPRIDAAIRALPVTCIEQVYHPDLLVADRYVLLYACTNDRSLNERIAADARHIRLPVNVVDDPSLCDFISPAVYRKGEMSVAVSSNGTDVRRSIAWRDRVRELFDAEP